MQHREWRHQSDSGKSVSAVVISSHPAVRWQDSLSPAHRPETGDRRRLTTRPLRRPSAPSRSLADPPLSAASRHQHSTQAGSHDRRSSPATTSSPRRPVTSAADSPSLGARSRRRRPGVRPGAAPACTSANGASHAGDHGAARGRKAPSALAAPPSRLLDHVSGRGWLRRGRAGGRRGPVRWSTRRGPLSKASEGGTDAAAEWSGRHSVTSHGRTMTSHSGRGVVTATRWTQEDGRVTPETRRRPAVQTGLVHWTPMTSQRTPVRRQGHIATAKAMISG